MLKKILPSALLEGSADLSTGKARVPSPLQVEVHEKKNLLKKLKNMWNLTGRKVFVLWYQQDQNIVPGILIPSVLVSEKIIVSKKKNLFTNYKQKNNI